MTGRQFQTKKRKRLFQHFLSRIICEKQAKSDYYYIFFYIVSKSPPSCIVPFRPPGVTVSHFYIFIFLIFIDKIIVTHLINGKIDV